MSLHKRGYAILFVGIILLALSVFITTDWGIWAWGSLFIASLLFCTVGIIMLIVHLFKQIKADKIAKENKE